MTSFTPTGAILGVVMNYRRGGGVSGYKTGGGGGASEVLLYTKKGEGVVLNILKGRHKTFWGSFNTGA